jgi:ribosomal protein S18 acetylase RimI-like enzyme
MWRRSQDAEPILDPALDTRSSCGDTAGVSEQGSTADSLYSGKMSTADVARSVALNEQELWRDMVRWSGGLVHEEDGLLFVAGPSSYLRVAIRLEEAVDGEAAVRRAGEFFARSDGDHIVLVREPADADVAGAALAAGYAPAWTERPMALLRPPEPSPLAGEIDIRTVSGTDGVLAYGTVVAEANDDPGERERAGLLFHGETILAPHIAAFVAYVEDAPAACAMTLVSHGVAGVFYVATVESARRRGLGDALTRMAARAGFALGARAAWLGASEMGAGLYRRIGFVELGTSIVEYESPKGSAG